MLFRSDFSGGLVQINTKDIPDENFLSIKLGSGFNSLTTFKPYYFQQGGKKDWLGIDDGTRQLPSDIPGTNDFVNLSTADKVLWAKKFQNTWGIQSDSSIAPNMNMQAVSGFALRQNKTTKFGGIIGVTYNSGYKF